MTPGDITLLCLVLCLSQKIQAREVLCPGKEIQAQEGCFPVPIISTTPSSVIPLNESVKILCRGTPWSFLYQLEILGNSTNKVVEEKFGFQEEAEFIINHMDTNTAGRYQCRYRKEYSWSEYSEALELVVTGLYDKPFLSTDQDSKLIPGKNISLQCGSAHILFDRFSLIEEGGATLPQHQSEGHQGNFILGPVSPGFSGNYRCYGWYSGSAYVWSAPSDALKLVVKDYTLENLIRMCMAGLVLVALLAILAENWHTCKVPHKEDRQDLPEPSWGKQKQHTEPLDQPLRASGLTSNSHQADTRC